METSLRRTGAGAAAEAGGKRLEIVIPDTHPAVTGKVLGTAAALARGLDAHITLICVRVIPWPAPVERSAAFQEQFARRVAEYAAKLHIRLSARLIFAREPHAAWACVSKHSVVLIGTRKRWWRTREEKLARDLARVGFRAAVIEVV